MFLTIFYLNQNNLSGKIPPEVADWKGLVELASFDNQLSGEIPYNLGRKSLNLKLVDMGGNQFEGRIPLCWGNNLTLKILILYYNRLTGKIPRTYGNCTNLSVVQFDSNLLEGHVPRGLWGGANLVRMMVNGTI